MSFLFPIRIRSLLWVPAAILLSSLIVASALPASPGTHQSRSCRRRAAIGSDDGTATGAAVISPCLRFVLRLSAGRFPPDTYQSACPTEAVWLRMPVPKPALCCAAWHQLRAWGPLRDAEKQDSDGPMSHLMPPYPSPSSQAVPCLFAGKPRGKVTQLPCSAAGSTKAKHPCPPAAQEDASAPFGSPLISKHRPRALQLDLLPPRELTARLDATWGTL